MTRPMKKGVKIFLIICLSLIVVTGIIVPLLPFMLQFNPAYGTPSFEFPMAEPLNVTGLSAYRTPDWGEVGTFHDGIDLLIESPMMIISPCYGIVSRIKHYLNQYGDPHHMITVLITVNLAWTVHLVFEPIVNTTELFEEQLSLIIVKVGTRVEPGDTIGTLMAFGADYYSHLHYGIRKFPNNVCPYAYSSATAKLAFEEIATRTNRTICFP